MILTRLRRINRAEVRARERIKQAENRAGARALRIAANIIGEDRRSALAQRCGYEPVWHRQAQSDAADLRRFADVIEQRG